MSTTVTGKAVGPHTPPLFMRYACLPRSGEYSVCPGHAVRARYFDASVDRFGLRPSIRFRPEAVAVEVDADVDADRTQAAEGAIPTGPLTGALTGAGMSRPSRPGEAAPGRPEGPWPGNTHPGGPAPR